MLASVTGRPPIPAMTTETERECYYRLAKDAAGKGEIVELGAWLGASTAYIAAGLRDSGKDVQVHVYDKFESKPAHAAKVKLFFDRQGIDPIPLGDCLENFKGYVGQDLMRHVAVHRGQIEGMAWADQHIALLVTDAPKRVPQIAAVTTKLRKALKPGSVMAWQDFCHFPSYEIPACLYRIRHHLEFVEAVLPGTTFVFRVKSQWEASEVSRDALALDKWSPEEIAKAWNYWLDVVPEETAALFNCGAILFLCDIGYPDKAVEALAERTSGMVGPEAVLNKWRYLHSVRPDLVKRYQPLFDFLQSARLL